MSLDETRLARARAARARLDDLQRAAARARARYREAILDLQGGGASLRDIAGALGVSDQRLEQVLERPDGRIAHRSVRTTGVDRCDFCGTERRHAPSFVAGPGVGICGPCVLVGGDVLSGVPAPDDMAGFVTVAPASRAHCSFCKRGARQVELMLAAGRACVCAGCLARCRRILAGRRAEPARIPLAGGDAASRPGVRPGRPGAPDPPRTPRRALN